MISYYPRETRPIKKTTAKILDSSFFGGFLWKWDANSSVYSPDLDPGTMSGLNPYR